jgi:hypothetical protein
MILTTREKTGFRLTKFRSSEDANLSYNDKSCIAFRGISEYLNCGDQVGRWDKEEAFSISAWIRTKAAYLVAGRGVWQRNTTGALNPGLYLLVGDQGPTLYLQGATFGSDEIIVRGDFPTLGDENWHHIVATYDGSGVAAGIDLYVNNSYLSPTVVANTLSTSILDPNNVATISRLNGYRGQIRQLSLWNKKLLQAEFEQLYDPNGNTPDIRDLSFFGDCEAWWRMGAKPHDIHPTILDWGPSGHHATMINAEPEDIQPIDTPLD